MVCILVSSELDSAMGAAFQSARPAGDPTFAHSEITNSFLNSDSIIRSILALPENIHGLELHPFIPTHSIAFEDIRERSNPALFHPQESIQTPQQTQPATDGDLRTSEANMAHWFILRYSDSLSPEQAAVQVKKSSIILKAEPVYERQPMFTPNDPDINQQYSLSQMHVFEAWDVVRCDSTMVVADADVGTDWTHPDLAAAIYNNPGEIGIDDSGRDKRSNGIDDDGNGFVDDWHGWDFAGPSDISGDNNPMPASGQSHGTHTAGILAATGNNGIGVAGVAFGAKVIPIKVQCDGCAYIDFGFQGIVYAADMHAKLVNCSFGGEGGSSAEQTVIDYAYAKDCAVIAAAGNYGYLHPFEYDYPAAYNHVLSVAMTNGNGNIDDGSFFNTQVDVAAPGIEIYSTVNDSSYTSSNQDGTSFACPNAAGVVALVRQRFPNFTAGQAMQQVRVTCDSIPGVDTNRIYYEGRGLVNALRAVSDTNTFAVRVDTFSIQSPNGSGTILPGENGTITIRARNYLKPLSHLKAKLQLVKGAPYVTLGQAVVAFGAVGTLQNISNAPQAFQISVVPNVPETTEILIRVFFYDSVAGYAADYDYIKFVVNPSYLDLNANNLTVTFSSIGSIGYNDVLINSQGSGFNWIKAPNSINKFSRQLLYEGGLMVGIDSQHVVDVVVGADGQTADEDLVPTVLTHYVLPPDRPNAAQEIQFALSDSIADSTHRIDLDAECQAYAFTQGLAANALVARYVIRGRTQGLLAGSDNAAAALFFDWDIGTSGALNIARYDSANQMALIYRLEPNYPYIGIKILPSTTTTEHQPNINFHAILNDGSQGGVNLYSAYTRAEKWNTMNQFFSMAGPGDISHTIGLKNMPIHSNDSVEMTVIIALAADDSTLFRTVADAQAAYENKLGVSTMFSSEPILEAFPNPFRNTLHIAWNNLSANGDAPAHITIYDAIGRTVCSQTVTGTAYDFAPAENYSGMYLVDVEIGGKHLRREVVGN